MSTATILHQVGVERQRQIEKHGDQTHLPDGTGPELRDPVRDDGTRRSDVAFWAKARTDAASRDEGDGTITFEHILTEEWAEALAESDPVLLRAELIQVAATAVQWIEALDQRATPRPCGRCCWPDDCVDACIKAGE